MIRLGLLSIHHDQELAYFTHIAKEASKYGISVVRFTPTSIQPITHDIEGFSYHHDTDEWVKATFPIPPYIYDRCFYTNDKLAKKNAPIVDWLKKNPNVTFLGHGLPTKWKIYEVLETVKEMKPFLPLTKQVTHVDDILNFLQEKQEIILKPSFGSQGKGIFRVRKLRNSYEILTQRQEEQIEKTFSTRDELMKFLEFLIKKKSFMMQPFYLFQTRNNEPFDLRILVQKNAKGEWEVKGKGIRVGAKNHIVSNLYSGAMVISYDRFISSFPPRNRAILAKDLETIIQVLPKQLEEAFGPLFELGIDIGIDRYMSTYVLDCNSKPGHRVAIETDATIEESIYSAPLKYCLFLKGKEAPFKNEGSSHF